MNKMKTTQLIIDKNISGKKNNSNLKLIILLIISFFILITIAYLVLNKATVKGVIIDSSDNTSLITGVNITLDGTKTISNNDLTGGFSFKNIKTGEHTLKFSRVGYKDKIENINLKMRQSLSLRIALDKFQEKILLNKDNSKFASISFNENLLSITNTTEKGSSISEVGERPQNIAYSPTRHKIYSQSVSDGIISVIDANTFIKLKDITFGGKYQIKRIRTSPTGDKLYAYIIEEHKIYIIDTSTDSIISSFEVNAMTMNFFVEPDLGNLYVLSTDSVSTFSSSGSEISSYKIKNPDFYSSIVVSTNKAFLAHTTNNLILMIDLNSNTESKFEVKESIKKLLCDRQNIYVLFDSSISVISINNTDNVKNIPLNITGNETMCFSKDKSKIYIANKSEQLNILDIYNQSLSDNKIIIKSNIRDFVEL
ncbi:MAG: carboxypeptidase-like regulatory domain-containing protein [Candidatus Sericytochromatia bacterium]